MTEAINAGYKKTEIGVLPVDWSVQTLEQLCREQITYGIVQCGPHIPNGVPYIRVSDMDSEELCQDNMLRTSIEIARSFARSTVACGDIVYALRGKLGEVRRVPIDLEGANLTQGTARLAPKVTIDSTYFLWSLREQGLLKRTDLDAKGSTFREITLAELRKQLVPVPPQEEQRRIGAALTDVDALITGLDQLITKKRDIQQAAMQQLLTGQRRLPGFSGEWSYSFLEDLADSRKPWSFTGGPFGSNLQSSDYTQSGVRIIQLQNIGDGRFHDGYAIFTSPKKADELLSCNVYPGDLILSKMGDPVARACKVPPSADRFLMCSDGIRLAVDETRFNTDFVLYSINFKKFRSDAEEVATGSTRKRIGLSDLRKLQIYSPELAEQAAIASTLSDMETEISAFEACRDKARILKQGMMQELLTGRIRLV